MIKVHNVCKKIGETEILRNIDFQIKKGEFVSVLGPNGAGKSTLFKCMANLICDFEGEITVFDKNIKKVK